MKKIILSMLVLVAIASCSEDKKPVPAEETKSTEETNKFIGTWENAKTTKEGAVTIIETLTIVFKDKELSMNRIITNDGVESSNENKEYTYTYTDKKITMQEKGNEEINSSDYSFSKKDGKDILTLSMGEDMEFTKK